MRAAAERLGMLHERHARGLHSLLQASVAGPFFYARVSEARLLTTSDALLCHGPEVEVISLRIYGDSNAFEKAGVSEKASSGEGPTGARNKDETVDL
jgi:hypothetical protein